MPDDKKPEHEDPKPGPAPPSAEELPAEDDWDTSPESPEGDATEPEDEAARDDEPPAEDKFRPEAIAARIDAIGEETDLDRVARVEEKKLLDRKRQKKKGKRGLESAASKRLAKIGEGHVKRPSAVASAVSPEADSLLESAARAKNWLGKHREVFGGLVAIAVLGAGGFFGWVYWQDKRNDDASAVLAQAFADQHGHINEKADDEDDDDNRARQLYPTFKSAADLREAALAKYRAVESKYPGTGAAILARLAEGALLLDSGDSKGALAAYDDVKASPLATADSEVRGRAIEGCGFADELLAQTDAAGAEKHRDEALAAYRELQTVDMTGMKELGMYHEARVLSAKGDKPKAIELLKDVHKLVSEPGESHLFSYLEFVVEDRLRELDPTALPPKTPKGAGGGAGPNAGVDSTNPQIQELMRQMNEKARQKGGAPQ
ncbi:MAG: hypothetical protein ACLP1X_12215 [Polyangiaceae bacterium]